MCVKELSKVAQMGRKDIRDAGKPDSSLQQTGDVLSSLHVLSQFLLRVEIIIIIIVIVCAGDEPRSFYMLGQELCL
jgi:hypothetical protein